MNQKTQEKIQVESIYIRPRFNELSIIYRNGVRGIFKGTQKQTIQFLKENDGVKVFIICQGESPTYLPRIEKIAKEAGYISSVEKKTYFSGFEVDIPFEDIEISGFFVKEGFE